MVNGFFWVAASALLTNGCSKDADVVLISASYCALNFVETAADKDC